MGKVIYRDFGKVTKKVPKQPQSPKVDISKVLEDSRTLVEGTIAPAKETVSVELAEERKVDPIKDVKDIKKISDYLIENKRYRDNMLFIVGINFGLRISDLLQLRFCHIIEEDMTFKKSFPLLEIKTKNTRINKKNRHITVNSAVIDSVALYLSKYKCSLSDYMFRSESGNGGKRNKPLTRMSVSRILKELQDVLCLDYNINTHSLRKTFAYHQMLNSNNDPRKLVLLQKMFGHSTILQTLDYIGITQEEVTEAYLNLNLGRLGKLVDSSLVEEDSTTALIN